jgi:hypothetical protein
LEGRSFEFFLALEGAGESPPEAAREPGLRNAENANSGGSELATEFQNVLRQNERGICFPFRGDQEILGDPSNIWAHDCAE